MSADRVHQAKSQAKPRQGELGRRLSDASEEPAAAKPASLSWREVGSWKTQRWVKGTSQLREINDGDAQAVQMIRSKPKFSDMVELADPTRGG